MREPLHTRQHTLKNYLEAYFISGKFFTIEEIVAGVKDSDGNPCYRLNKNPYVHDKCIALSQDVKKLNWATNVERYIPIIKDKKGGIKLAETKEELEAFVKSEKRKVEKANEYANHLQSLIDLDGTMPIINLANRALTPDEMKVVGVYKNEGV